MPDYKEMYKIMFRAAERAANILIEAQRECEELYISAPTAELKLIPPVDDGEEIQLKNFCNALKSREP